MTPLEFHSTVMNLDARYPLSETSGKRTVKRNASPDVQGDPNSRHLFWTGRDVVLDDMSPANRAAFCKEARRQGLVAVDEGDHIHLQVP